MSELERGAELIDCGEIVYRALRKRWLEGESILPEAFLRRIIQSAEDGEKHVEDGVSLSRRKHTTARECRQKLSRMIGAASLHVGAVRDFA